MSNFQFLHSEWPDIFREATEAEKYVHSAPKFSALQSRIVLEMGLNWLYDNDPELERPYDTTLSSLLHQTSFRNSIKPSLFRELNLVRKLGNNAAHGTRVLKQEALISLRSVYRFCSYLSKYYSEDNPEISEFNEAILLHDGGNALEKTNLELQARIEGYEKQLDTFIKEREHQEELAKENDILKQWIADQKQIVRERKSEREQVLTFEQAVPELTPEAETRKVYIDVLLEEAGWKNLKMGHELEFPVEGMPKSTNPSGIGYADYVLWGDNGLPLAVIEAKQTMVDASKGRHQATLYADCLERMTGQRPIIFYTNGFETHLWDDLFYPEREVMGFLTKDELQSLIERRKTRKDPREFKANLEIAGRYYQLEAIKRVAEAYATTVDGDLRGNSRNALLVMATGSGKTRTAAAIVDMMVKSNWVKRILFLADRNALVTQAKNAFKEYLPHLSAIDLTKETEDNGTRVVFSTYPTIMNKIDELKNEEGRFYGVGHFDLIIIDEAHRSVYKKYGAIFDYFDSMLLGLTATPKKELFHDTYQFFGIEDDIPTFAYELNQAVSDKFLVPPKAMNVPVKFVHEGIKYNELSEDDKAKFEETFGIAGDEVEIDKGLINTFLFNDDTVDKVLDHLMTQGIKVEGGEKLGKTIIFAKNHKHAKFIEKRFNANYPGYSGKFLRVIDNYEAKAQDLLEKFCEDKENLNPQIAVSVDMMDTGVDAPRVVNLVFFKQVRSYTKYWQMIGRGTRLREDLYGPGNHKSHFLIFDICDNFSYFGDNPDRIVSGVPKSLSQKIFETKLNIIQEIRNNTDATADEDEMAERYTDDLYQSVAALNNEHFQVRKEGRLVTAFKNRERWNNISAMDMADLNDKISGLVSYGEGDDELAKRFDLLTLRYQLALLGGAKSYDYFTSKLHDISVGLQKKRTIPVVASKLPRLKTMTEPEFYATISQKDLEEIREEIRDLIKFIERDTRNPMYTDFEDVILTDKVGEVDIMLGFNSLQSYRDRVESFIRKNKSHLVIDKLHKNVPITDKELELLESFVFNEEIGSIDDYRKEYGDLSLSKFIRGIVGLDVVVANQLFAEFIQDHNLSAAQMAFINRMISYLNKNGTLDKGLLVKPPFNETHEEGIIGLFQNEADVRKLVSIIDRVNENAG